MELLAPVQEAQRPVVGSLGLFYEPQPPIPSPLKWAPLTRLKSDPLPLLVEAFHMPDRQVRVYVLQLLKRLVERGPGQRTDLPGGVVELRWEIPAGVESVLDQAQADRDEEVRELAAGIGKLQWSPNQVQRGYGGCVF